MYDHQGRRECVLLNHPLSPIPIMRDYKLLLDNEHASEIEAAVRQGLRSADPAGLPPRQHDYQPLYLSVRDSSDAIIGGLYGMTMWSWLLIDGLWVAEAYRGHGFGSRLLTEAEAHAVQRGCRGAWLGTFDFQARAFYERHGYVVFAELDGFPPGHKHLHLRKTFDTPTAPA
jgi:GNAT superfamily N-acetyltransferase